LEAEVLTMAGAIDAQFARLGRREIEILEKRLGNRNLADRGRSMLSTQVRYTVHMGKVSFRAFLRADGHGVRLSRRPGRKCLKIDFDLVKREIGVAQKMQEEEARVRLQAIRIERTRARIVATEQDRAGAESFASHGKSAAICSTVRKAGSACKRYLADAKFLLGDCQSRALRVEMLHAELAPVGEELDALESTVNTLSQKQLAACEALCRLPSYPRQEELEKTLRLRVDQARKQYASAIQQYEDRWGKSQSQRTTYEESLNDAEKAVRQFRGACRKCMSHIAILADALVQLERLERTLKDPEPAQAERKRIRAELSAEALGSETLDQMVTAGLWHLTSAAENPVRQALLVELERELKTVRELLEQFTTQTKQLDAASFASISH